MDEQKPTYEQFKADILQWKNTHREEYSRFARLMTNGDERQYLAICRSIFKQLPKIKTEWELCWNDDSKDDFNDIDLLFKEESVPKQIVETFQKQRENNNSNDSVLVSLWGRVKSFFSGKYRHITLSAPLVLSWLYYGKSFEAMVGMIDRQMKNPKADKADRMSCSFVIRQIIDVSVKKGFRTKADWDRYFSMNEAIEKGNAGEWALQSVTDEMVTDNDNNTCVTNLEEADTDVTPTVQRTAGKKKIQERPLAAYLDCENKEAVISCIRNFITVNASAVHQALPFYVLKDLRLVAGMHTAKEYSTGLTLQFPDLLALKSESAIRQAIGFLKTARHVIKDGKDQSALLIESDENRELFRTLVKSIRGITGTDKETDMAE